MDLFDFRPGTFNGCSKGKVGFVSVYKRRLLFTKENKTSIQYRFHVSVSGADNCPANEGHSNINPIHQGDMLSVSMNLIGKFRKITKKIKDLIFL